MINEGKLLPLLHFSSDQQEKSVESHWHNTGLLTPGGSIWELHAYNPGICCHSNLRVTFKKKKIININEDILVDVDSDSKHFITLS